MSIRETYYIYHDSGVPSGSEDSKLYFMPLPMGDWPDGRWNQIVLPVSHLEDAFYPPCFASKLLQGSNTLLASDV